MQTVRPPSWPLPDSAQESERWWAAEFLALAHGAAVPCDQEAIEWLRQAFTGRYEQLADPGR
eukprot:1400730-Alexandrium_andersonii.AAC.1